MLARYLQRASKIDCEEVLHAHAQYAIDELLDNIHGFFSGYESEKRPLWRLAQTGRVVQQVESFHRMLDAITARCGLAVVPSSGTGPSLPRWQARWRRMRAERLVFFRSYLENHAAAGVSYSRVREPADQLELLTLLKHDTQKFDTVLTADELELLGRTFTFVATCCNNTMNLDTEMHLMSLPEWFVAPYERTKQQLKWQRAAVAVQKASRSMDSRDCFALASTWSRLQHPHIMKLFGCCHVGRRRFFVVAEGTPLTRCLGDDGFPLWRALHEAALALRYLHERRVGLDTLSCADLVLFRSGDRDAVMLAGFNVRQMKSALESSSIFGIKKKQEEDQDPLLEDDESDAGFDEVDTIHQHHDMFWNPTTSREKSSDGPHKKFWRAPELLSRGAMGPTDASDVFALGMCVIEAFSGGNIWGDNAQEDNIWRLSGIPPRPAALSDAWQWALVERMCSPDPRDRPSLTEVLASFQVFAEDEEKANADFATTKRRKKSTHHSVRQMQPRATSAAIACALSEVQAWCDEASESSGLNYQLYERMDDVAARLETMVADSVVSHLPTLAALVLRFRDFLQRHVNENLLLRLAATRHVIDVNLGLHGELNSLMDRLGLNRSGASIHSWKAQQASYSEQLWKRMRLSLSMDAQTLSGELDGDQELSFLGALLSFEANKRSSSYSAQDLEMLQTSLVKVEETYQIMMPGPAPGFRTTESKSILALPPWFVPPYEVIFNELDAFSRGAFGSVHFGKWMESDVVVKKMLTTEEHEVIPLRSRRAAKSNAKEPSQDPYKRFMDEMSVWSDLKHPNVLKLFGACHVGPHQFFLCEFASQGSIDTYVSSKSTDDRGVFARRMLHEAALGLHYLHTQKIVHADLKCSNILVDARGLAKLTDFGVSSLTKRGRLDHMTVDGENVAGGACRWVAPECLAGETATFASNVYSFAMCAIEVVSGEPPWGWEMTDAAIHSKVRKGLLPPRPANFFSDSEWSLIERMCCHDPTERITVKEAVRLLA